MSSMDELVAALKTAPSAEDVKSGERIARVLQARMKADNDITVSKKRTMPWNYIGIAAAIVIAVFGIKYIPSKTQTPQSKTYSTIPGQRASFLLADGSNVILAPATRLTVTGRSMELQGEAVFTVNQNTGEPFIVKSGNTITRVLGTTFGIRAYDDRIRIAVTEGKISISNTSQSPAGAQWFSPGQRPGSDIEHVMTVGDVAEISNTHTTISHNIDLSDSFSWTTGTLTLRKVTLAEAFENLERWYGLELSASDPALLSLTVDATFPATYNPGLIQDLAGVVGARAKIQGHTITFSPDK